MEFENEIGVFEAKTHFSQVVDNVERGADYTVTRRGKPVAKIIPIEKEPEVTFQQAVENLLAMRKYFKGDPKTFNLREAIEKGRR